MLLETEDFGEILVINVARIGDTLLVTPALRALKERFPFANLTVLAHPKRKEVLQGIPFIDHLRGITPKRARWMGWLSGKRYDLALVYGKDLPLVRYALRIARHVVVVGWKDLPPAKHLTVVPPLSRDMPLHAVDERMRLVEVVGAKPRQRRLAFWITDDERRAAEEWLRARGVENRHPVIGLQICSFPTKAHRDWPLESFRTLMASLAIEWPTSVFVILGDHLARAAAVPLIQAFQGRVLVAAGKTNLRQAGALISQLDLYIGVDTGPTHIAGALDIPMIAMYHADYPGCNLAPLDRPGCIVLEHPLTGLVAPGVATMADINVDSVLNAVRRLLLN